MHGVKRGKTRRLHQTVTYRYGALTHSILGLTSTKTTELVQRTAGPAPPAAATLGCSKVSRRLPAPAMATEAILVPAVRPRTKPSTQPVTAILMEAGISIQPRNTGAKPIAGTAAIRITSMARTACPMAHGADHPRRSTAAACRAVFAVTARPRLARTAIPMEHGQNTTKRSTSARKSAPFAVTARQSTVTTGIPTQMASATIAEQLFR